MIVQELNHQTLHLLFSDLFDLPTVISEVLYIGYPYCRINDKFYRGFGLQSTIFHNNLAEGRKLTHILLIFHRPLIKFAFIRSPKANSHHQL